MTHAHEHKPLVHVEGLQKIYGTRTALVHALNDVTFTINTGEYIAIMGPSGSGKSTLLSCIASLERPASGRISVDGEDIVHMTKHRLARFRREKLGFIFQDSHLIQTLNGFENIALALTLKGEKTSNITKHIEELAQQLDITEQLSSFPAHMSGGQRQKIAIARALVTSPTLILADEPTGALDSRSTLHILDTFTQLNTQHNSTIAMVTHDPYAASFSQRVLFIRDGKIFNEIIRGTSTHKEYYSKIMEVQAFLGGGNHVS